MRVALVNPPFAHYRRPSIALTQLRQAVRDRLPAALVAIHNVNLDCVPLLGTDWYMEISDGFQSWTGLGDWLFRPLALPDAADNADEYLDWLSRQVSTITSTARKAAAPDLGRRVLEAREALCEALPGIIARRGLADHDVVGVTSMFAQTFASLAILRLVKQANPDVVTVMGGANCEAPMGDALLERFDFVDRAFSGRATASFPAFLEQLGQRGDLASMPAIAGVLRRERDGEEPGPVIEPDPFAGPALGLDYDDFIEELAAAPFDSEVILPFETSTGCWWGEKSHCTFCGLNSNTMKFQALSPEAAVEQIQGLVDRYSHVCKTFEATDNILSLGYFKAVLPRLRIPDDVTLFYEIKANLSVENLKALAAARVLRIQPGIEALSTEAVKLLRKGVDGGRNVALLRNCRAEGISADWNLLVGIPGETLGVYEHFLRQAPRLAHLEPPAGAFDIRYDRYSPYFSNPDSFGLKLAPFEFYSYLFPFSTDWIERVACFFRDAPDRPQLSAETLGLIGQVRDAIAAWHDRWLADPPPGLDLEDGADGAWVRDGRGIGEASAHPVTPEQLAALDYLAQPRTLTQLNRHLLDAGWSSRRVDRAVATIQENGWTFDEGATLTSLVVDRRRPAYEAATGDAGHREAARRAAGEPVRRLAARAG